MANSLLVVTCILWLVLTGVPALDRVSPSVFETSKDKHFPVTETILQLLLLPASLLSLYCLMQQSTGPAGLSRSQQILAVTLVCLAASGVGNHVVAGTLQGQMQKDDEIYALVDFLHESWSHNVMFSSWFAGLLYSAWCETCLHLGAVKKTADNSARSHTVTSWLLALLMGPYFSVLAPLTNTVKLVIVFYISVVLLWCAMYKSSHKSSAVQFWSDINRTDNVLPFLIRATMIGLPLAIAAILI